MSKKITLEEKQRFSQSLLWQWQREYFDQMGINAWVSQVPFYVTSNPFIAQVYAKLLLSFARDQIQKNPEAIKHPFYILELGTGSGRFSFYVLKKLHELQKKLKLERIQFQYIMSDFTESNLHYWENHPAFKPYDKQLDFAVYNLESAENIQLIKQNRRLNSSDFFNPLAVIANYIFDTVSHDAFQVKNNKLYELLITLESSQDNLKEGKPADWNQLQVRFESNEIDPDYYEDKDYNALLSFYQNTIKESHFLLPVGGLNTIKQLSALSQDKLFLISSDKGYIHLESLENLAHPHIAFHGSFSMMVNFHAIGSYFKNNGGDYFPQTQRKGIKTLPFTLGFTFEEMPQTAYAIQEVIEDLSPADYFILHRRISDSFEECPLETLASHLSFACWDPHIYARLSSRINHLLKEGDALTIDFLAQNMHKITEQFYYMEKAANIFFDIGVFYHSLNRYEQALNYYQQGIEYFGEQVNMIYNSALCLYHLKRTDEALTYFKKAYEISPETQEAEDWIKYLTQPNQ